jgi:hypothetical protein
MLSLWVLSDLYSWLSNSFPMIENSTPMRHSCSLILCFPCILHFSLIMATAIMSFTGLHFNHYDAPLSHIWLDGRLFHPLFPLALVLTSSLSTAHTCSPSLPSTSLALALLSSIFHVTLVPPLCSHGVRWSFSLSQRKPFTQKSEEDLALDLPLQQRYSVESYHAHTPPNIHAEIDLAEADIQVLRHFVATRRFLTLLVHGSQMLVILSLEFPST